MLDKLIGNTPMIKINYRFENKKRAVYAKLEYYNYTGSIKDRVANYIITESKKLGLLKDNQAIIEATSGNTGISLAAIGAYYHHPVYIFMPDWASKERIKIMELYGAHVYLVSKDEGGFLGAIKKSQELAKKLDGFLPRQFENELNLRAHYELTGQEIVSTLSKIDAFVSGIGTGGTLIGIGKRLKEEYPNLKVIALEPSKMPLLSQNKKYENHKIEGIGDDFIPEIVDKDMIDEIILIDDEDAINMARIFAKKLGLGVGISSGANFLAAVLSNQENVVTIFPDDLKKYLTTDLTKKIKTDKDFISNKIELLGFEVIKIRE